MSAEDRIQGITGNISVKVPCIAATTANITLSATQTIDGIAVVTGDRVLVKSQTSSIDNGIYKVSTGAWTRTKDFNGNGDIRNGTIVLVTTGSTQAINFFRVSVTEPVTIGTSAITFAAVNGAFTGTYQHSAAGSVQRSRQSKDSDIVDAADFGMLPGLGSGVSQTTAFNAAVAAVIASGSKRLHISAGVYYLNTQPASIAASLEIYGDGLNSTVLIRNYNGTAAQGLIRLVPGASGFQLRRLAIDAASGTSGGHAISAVADATTSIDGVVFEDLWISTFGTDTWSTCIHIDGTLKITGAVGIREMAWRNVNVFGAALRSVTLTGVVDFSWQGGGIYTAGGTGVGSILIDGTASIDSTYVSIDVPSIQGKVTTGYATYVNVRAPVMGAVENNGNSDYVSIQGSVPSYQSNWTNSGVHLRPPLYGSTSSFDPADLATGASAEASVTVLGAAIGDHVLGAFSLNTSGITLSGYVSAADTVKIRFTNNTGGNINLGSGTVYATVLKRP